MEGVRKHKGDNPIELLATTIVKEVMVYTVGSWEQSQIRALLCWLIDYGSCKKKNQIICYVVCISGRVLRQIIRLLEYDLEQSAIAPHCQTCVIITTSPLE